MLTPTQKYHTVLLGIPVNLLSTGLARVLPTIQRSRHGKSD